MVQVDADVLLIDEILAVGDAAFQQKCFDVFFRLRDEGKTIVLVTHDMAAVDRFCHRAVLLEEGRVVALGDPSEVADRYMDMNFEPGTDADPGAFGGERGGDGGARVLEAWVEDEHGARSDTVPQGTPARSGRACASTRSCAIPSSRWRSSTPSARTCSWPRTCCGDFAAGDEAVVGVTFHNALAPGPLRAVRAAHAPRGRQRRAGPAGVLQEHRGHGRAARRRAGGPGARRVGEQRAWSRA